MELFNVIIEHIDPKLYPVVANLIIFGYWIKQRSKYKPLPKWMPKVPMMLILISFAMCTLFGWVFSTGDGVKSILESVLVYGVSNGIMCAAFAMMAYDNVHVYTKKLGIDIAAELSAEKIYLATRPVTRRDKQMKWILYGGTAVVGAIIGALFASLAGGQDWFYTVMWSIFAGGIASVVARVIYHIVINDNSAETWQISIYGLIACCGWIGAIYSKTPGTDVLTFAVVIGASMMMAGTRFLVAPQDTEEILKWLMAHSRYKYIDDNPLLGDDESKPIAMVVEGVSLTPDQAATAGFPQLAEEAKKYLEGIYNLQKDAALLMEE